MPEATLANIKALMRSTEGFTDAQITAQIEVQKAYVRRYCNRETADIPSDEVEAGEYTDDTKRTYWIDDEGTDDYPWPVLQVIADLIFDTKRDKTVSSVRFADMQTTYEGSSDITSDIMKPINQYRIIRVI